MMIMIMIHKKEKKLPAKRIEAFNDTVTLPQTSLNEA